LVVFFLGALSAVALGGFAYLGWIGYIADSEIWSVTIAKHFAEEWLHPWVFTRPLFYGTLALAEAPFAKAVPIFLAARAACLLNALLIMALTFTVAKALSRKQSRKWAIAPWLALFLLLVNTGFLNQGYRIRSDLFTCCLVLLALRMTANENTTPRLKAFWWCVPLLATPKSVLQILPALAYMKTPRARTFAVQVFLGAFLLLVVVYPRGLEYFISTFTDPELNRSFFSPERFFYMSRVLEQNKIFSVLAILRAFTFLWRKAVGAFESSTENRRQTNFAAFITLSVLVMILTPEKVPFFIAAFIPLVCIFISFLYEDLYALLPKLIPASRSRFYLRASLITILTIACSLSLNAGKHWVKFKDSDNSSAQLSAIRILESLLEEFPGATYFDVIGLVPQRATFREFAGPNDPDTNKNTIRVLKGGLPNLIFYVRKLFFLEPEMRKIITDNYFEISSLIYARWDRLDKPASLKSHDSREKIRQALEKSAAAVGRPDLSTFSVLLSGSPGKKPWHVEILKDDLFNPRKTSKNFTVLAVSPFIQMKSWPGFLPSLIRFDWD
jgi:hypothetical protein